MAEKIKFICTEPARLIYSSVAVKSAPKGVMNATPKFSATVGIGEADWNLIKPLMIQLITAETGSFSGNPNDYYLACMPGKIAAQRVRDKATLDANAARAREGEDAAFKIIEKAEKRATLYEQFAGILQGSSQFDIELAKLEAGKIVDIKGEVAIAQAGKDLFYSGAWVVPAISLQGFRRKTLDAKDGVTGFLQNMLFVRKGESLGLGGGGAANSEVFGGFANYSDYDPLAMAPGASESFAPPPVADGRPADPKFIHANPNGTEQWYLNGAWDGGQHPAPPDASAPPAPVAQPMW